RRRHTSFSRDWSSDVCSSDLESRDIPIAYGNPAVDLLISPDGKVMGAITETKTGERTAIGAKAVILATNGFGANRELLARFCPRSEERRVGKECRPGGAHVEE